MMWWLLKVKIFTRICWSLVIRRWFECGTRCTWKKRYKTAPEKLPVMTFWYGQMWISLYISIRRDAIYMVESAWLMFWKEVTCCILLILCSDHHPLLVAQRFNDYGAGQDTDISSRLRACSGQDLGESSCWKSHVHVTNEAKKVEESDEEVE